MFGGGFFGSSPKVEPTTTTRPGLTPKQKDGIEAFVGNNPAYAYSAFGYDDRVARYNDTVEHFIFDCDTLEKTISSSKDKHVTVSRIDKDQKQVVDILNIASNGNFTTKSAKQVNDDIDALLQQGGKAKKPTTKKPTKTQLYEKAKKMKIDGRSKMTYGQLLRATRS